MHNPPTEASLGGAFLLADGLVHRRHGQVQHSPLHGGTLLSGRDVFQSELDRTEPLELVELEPTLARPQLWCLFAQLNKCLPITNVANWIHGGRSEAVVVAPVQGGHVSEGEVEAFLVLTLSLLTYL